MVRLLTTAIKWSFRLSSTVQSFFYGSKSQSILHPLEGDDLARHRAHIDAIYDDFKRRVVEGRQISPELIELLAGGALLPLWHDLC